MDIKKRQAQRIRVLGAIFTVADGSEEVIVRIVPRLQQILELSEQEIIRDCHYLLGEGLIKAPIKVEDDHIVAVQLTHRGIKRVEQSLEPATEYHSSFIPSISVINVHGDVIGSAIQNGSAEAQQEMSVQELNLGDSAGSRGSTLKD